MAKKSPWWYVWKGVVIVAVFLGVTTASGIVSALSFCGVDPGTTVSVARAWFLYIGYLGFASAGFAVMFAVAVMMRPVMRRMRRERPLKSKWGRFYHFALEGKGEVVYRLPDSESTASRDPSLGFRLQGPCCAKHHGELRPETRRRKKGYMCRVCVDDGMVVRDIDPYDFDRAANDKYLEDVEEAQKGKG